MASPTLVTQGTGQSDETRAAALVEEAERSSQGGSPRGLEETGLSPQGQETARGADIAAKAALEGKGEEKATTGCLSRIVDPIAKVWNETIWPGIQKVIDLARDHLCCWCCPATKEAPEVKVETGKELSAAEAFQILEEQRFDNRNICSTPSFAGAAAARLGSDKGTVPRQTGLGLRGVVNWDTKFVGGKDKVSSQEEAAELLKGVDVKAAYREFRKLDRAMREEILVNVYIANEAIEDDGEEGRRFATEVFGDQELFTQHLPGMRPAVGAFFRAQAQTILQTRASRSTEPAGENEAV